MQQGLEPHVRFSCLSFLFEGGGPPLLDGGRDWAVLTAANAWWMHGDRYSIVVAAWPWHDDDEYIQVNPDEDIDNRKLGVHRRVISTAGLRNKDQWGGLVLIRICGEWLGHIEAWVRTCSCHSAAMREHFWPHTRYNCFLNGCKLVDVAAGCLHTHLEEGYRPPSPK